MKCCGRNICLLAFLYFVQGMPYGLQARYLPIYLRTRGLSLTNVSYFKILLIPWMCKALWAPLVDTYGSKKSWLQWSMLGLLVTCFIGSFIDPVHMISLVVIMLMFNILTATQDIAVDGIAINILTLSELANGNIAQVVGYKLGMIMAGGLFTWLIDYISWRMLFLALSIVYGIAVIVVFKVIPQSMPSRNNTTQDTYIKENHLRWLWSHFARIIDSRGTKWTLLFVLVYKLGEQGVLNLIPLYLLDHNASASHVGLWTGVIGQFSSILGSFVGGQLISPSRLTSEQVVRYCCTLRLVPLVIHVLIIASGNTDWNPFFSDALLASMIFMLIVSGVVTMATFTMMMQCSQHASEKIQASHYTTLATFEVIGKLTFSIVIGPITDMCGYLASFILCLLLSIIVLPLFKYRPSYLSKMSGETKNK